MPWQPRPTLPRHVLDFLFWPLLRPIWEKLLGSRKNSHFWHWRNFSTLIAYPLNEVPPDTTACSRKNVWANFWESNFHWKECVILAPANNSGPFQMGYEAREGRTNLRKLCTIVLDGPFAALRGPDPTIFFAVTLDGAPVRLQIMRLLSKKDLPPDIFLV